MVSIPQLVSFKQLQQEKLNGLLEHKTNNYPNNIYNAKNEVYNNMVSSSEQSRNEINNYKAYREHTNNEVNNEMIQQQIQNKNQMNNQLEHQFIPNNESQNQQIQLQDQNKIQFNNQNDGFYQTFGEAQWSSNKKINGGDINYSEQKVQENEEIPLKQIQQSPSTKKQYGEKYIIEPIQNFGYLKKYNTSARKQSSNKQYQVQYIPQNIKQNLNQSISERQGEKNQNEFTLKDYNQPIKYNSNTAKSQERKSNQKQQLSHFQNQQIQQKRYLESKITQGESINQHKKITKFRRNPNQVAENNAKAKNSNENNKVLNNRKFIDEDQQDKNDENVTSENSLKRDKQMNNGDEIYSEGYLNFHDIQSNNSFSLQKNNGVCKIFNNIKHQLKQMQQMQMGQQYIKEQLQFISDLNKKQLDENDLEYIDQKYNFNDNHNLNANYASQKQENTPKFVYSQDSNNFGISGNFTQKLQNPNNQNQTDEYHNESKINKYQNPYLDVDKLQVKLQSSERGLNKDSQMRNVQQGENKQKQIQLPQKVYEDNETQTLDLIKYQSHLEYLATLNQMRQNQNGSYSSRSYFQPQVMGPNTNKSYAELVGKMQNYYNQQSKYLFDSITNKKYHEYQTSSRLSSQQIKNVKDSQRISFENSNSIENEYMDTNQYNQNIHDNDEIRSKRSLSEFSKYSLKHKHQNINEQLNEKSNKQMQNQSNQLTTPIFNLHPQLDIDQNIFRSFSFQQQQSNVSNQEQQQNNQDQQFKSPSDIQQKQTQRLRYLSESKHTSPFDQDQISQSDQQMISPSESQQNSSSTQQKISLQNSQQESCSSLQRSSINSQNKQRTKGEYSDHISSTSAQQYQKIKQSNLNQYSDNYGRRDSYQQDSQFNTSSNTTCENIQSPIQMSLGLTKLQKKNLKTSIILDQSESSKIHSPILSQSFISSSHIQSQYQLDQNPSTNYPQLNQQIKRFDENNYINEQRQQHKINNNHQNIKTNNQIKDQQFSPNSIQINIYKNLKNQNPIFNQQYNTTIQSNPKQKQMNIKMVAIMKTNKLN